jgi:hypothetical protein
MHRTRLLVPLSLVLLACTAGEPKPDPNREPDRATEPDRTRAATQTSEPEPELTTEWWCVCYQNEGKGEDGPQPATSCRAQEKQCRALERRITAGGRGIVANSLTHTCRKLSGEHPGDTTGGRERWKPSKLEGAWTSDECLLPGPPDHIPGPPADDDPLAGEAIGKLRLNMSASEVADLLRADPTKGEIMEEGATGDFVQTWTFAAAGVDLGMAAATADGPQFVSSVRVSAPCDFETARGIRIGSTWEEVSKAYGDVYNEEQSTGHFVAGSLFGGIIFDFENDAVSSIFLGAAAE